MQMTQIPSAKTYDLADRTFKFAQACRVYVKELSRSLQTIEDGKQLIRSSGSVAANYIEANEALSRKDFAMRIKICRKEAKESILWLRLLGADEKLTQEATELMKIFGAIVEKTG